MATQRNVTVIVQEPTARQTTFRASDAHVIHGVLCMENGVHQLEDPNKANNKMYVWPLPGTVVTIIGEARL